MLAPISWRVPPREYGPWELVVWLLTEGLVDRGVDVTLFATGDSDTRAKLEKFLALIDKEIEEGMATLEEIRIHFYRSGKAAEVQ